MTWFPGLTIEAAERMCIEGAMKFYQGNKTQAAKALGIVIRTLDAKLEGYIKAEDERIKAQEIRHAKQEAEQYRLRGLNSDGSLPSGVNPPIRIQTEPENEIGQKERVPLFVSKKKKEEQPKPSPTGPIERHKAKQS